MKEIIEFWPLLIAAAAIVSISVYGCYVFINKPTDEQLHKVKEWLLFAVAEAEKELGSGTGQLKLRYTYDMFLTKFPYLSKFISFEIFSKLVDEALDEFKHLLEINGSISAYVEGE